MFLPEEILAKNQVSVIGIGIVIGVGVKISCCLFGIKIPKIWGAASTWSRKKGWGYEVLAARSNDKVRRQLCFGQFWTSLSRDLSLVISLSISAELKWIRDFNFMV